MFNRTSYNGGYNDLKCVCNVINDLGMTTGMTRDAQELGWAKRVAGVDVSLKE